MLEIDLVQENIALNVSIKTVIYQKIAKFNDSIKTKLTKWFIILACVIKSSYGMYTVGTIVEVAVTVFVGLTIFVEMMKKDFYYVNLISHAIACKDNW